MYINTFLKKETNMSKFTYGALVAALFSLNAHAAPTAAGDEVQLDAEFTVGTPPTQLTAAWRGTQGLEPGTFRDGQEVGLVTVTGGSGDGWVLYGVNNNSSVEAGQTTFTFTHDDGTTIKTKVAVNNGTGVLMSHGPGTGAGLPGAATFITGTNEAQIVTHGQQTLKSGVYSTRFGVQSFSN